MTTPTQQGTSGSTGVLGGTPQAPTGLAGQATALHNTRQNATFPTLNPPDMKTLVYAPDVTIIISHNGVDIDISKDIVRGQIVRKENSASSLFVTINNHNLMYTAPPAFARMDRITCYLTRTTRIQVFSGYLDTIPWIQAYPGTVDIRATCTLKRLLHTWWNPALPASQQLFQDLGPSNGTAGDNQAVSGTSLGGIVQNLLEKVGGWTPNTVHVQDFPQKFITFLNNYMAETQMAAHNATVAQQYSSLILGDDTAPGPMGAVGYQAGDPVGTATSAQTAANPQFYLSQFVAACDQRGLGPLVDSAANSQTITQTADIAEAATSSTNDISLQRGVNQAGAQLGQYASNWNTQNQNSDATILALAAATVETGLQMLANNTDPPTLTFFNTGQSTNGSSAGLFGMPNNGAWGTPAQRMNPFSSAGMFFDKLNSITGWRNMDGGQAIWLVLQTASSQIAKYDAAIPAAAKTVLAYRQQQQGASNAANAALGAIPGAGGVAGLLGGGANPIGSITGALGNATTSPISAASGAMSQGRPVPDSEGAINAAMSLIGTPYQFGGSSISTGIDCSRMVELAFIAGTGIDVTRSTPSQRAFIPAVVPFTALQRGDVVQTEGGGHTGIALGNGSWIQTGGGNMPGPQPLNTADIFWVGRVCQNGGPGAAPFTPITGATGGGAPGTGSPPGGTGGPMGGGGGATGSEPIARNLFSFMFYPGAYDMALADFLTGEKQYIDDQPLMQMVRALCQASLRNFQSAPNGDFIAYYPDEFGLDGKQAVVNLEDIELTDCHIDLSDDNLTTHVYIEGDYTMIGQADQGIGWLATSGVATVENPWLFQRLASAAPGDVDQNLTAEQLMGRFGVRPYKDSYQMAGNAGLEFLLACTIFMGKWAGQYETDIGMTFMPELYPGMRINMANHNLTVYCSAVNHSFDWEKGFSTTATVSAAGNPNASAQIFSSLPGFINPVSTSPQGGGNTNNFAAPLAGGPLDFGAGSFFPAGQTATTNNPSGIPFGAGAP